MNQNILEMTNVLLNDEENNKTDYKLSMGDITKTLNMDETVLSTCNKKSATSTARCLIKLFCLNSDSNLEYGDMDKSIINSIIGES